MPDPDASRPSALAIVHAVLFVAGITLLLSGALLDRPWLSLSAGVCLSASGVLIWAGSRIAFAGPVGDLLRMALGRRRLFTLHLRAVFWMALGVLITLGAVQRLRAPSGTDPAWQVPWAGCGRACARRDRVWPAACNASAWRLPACTYN